MLKIKKEVLLALSLVLISILMMSCSKDTTEAETEKEIQENITLCEDECIESSCDNLEFIDCVDGEDGCKKQQSKGKVLEECRVECFSDLNCKSGQVCTDFNKCLTLPEETQSLDNIFKEKKDELEKQKLLDDKLDRCTKMCAGDRYSVLAIKDLCYDDCYQVYYNKGEEELDQHMINLSQNP